MQKHIFYILIIYLFFANACDFKNSKARVITIADSTNIQEKVLEKTYISHNDFYKKVLESNYDYERNLLNSTINIKRYTTDTTIYKAKLVANLGVYLADFTYATLNNDGEDALNFLQGIERMNTAIQTQVPLDSHFTVRLKLNLVQKDSLFKISGQVYHKLDEILRRTEQNDLSIVMLAGIWVESMYHKLKIIELNQPDSLPELTKKNQKLLHEVLTQQESIQNLHELFKVIAKRNKLGSLMYGINILQKAFEEAGLKTIESKGKNTIEVAIIDKSGELSIKRIKVQDISETSLKNLSEKITAIRFEIIK